jgi:hypothetical protein
MRRAFAANAAHEGCLQAGRSDVRLLDIITV